MDSRLLKRTLGAAAILLIGQGCVVHPSAQEMMNSQEIPNEVPTFTFTEGLEGPQSTWLELVDAGVTRNCDALKSFSASSLQVSGTDCARAYVAFKDGAPEIDWDATILHGGTRADIYMTNGAMLTTLVLEEEVWKIEKKFW